MKSVIMKFACIASTLLFRSEIALSQSCNHSQANRIAEAKAPRRTTEHAPFDGGLGLLIVAGAIYGLKKRHDKRKRIKEAVSKSGVS